MDIRPTLRPESTTGKTLGDERGIWQASTWQQATGPASAAGKAAAARNAYTGGHTVTMRRLTVELNRLLSEQAQSLADAAR